MIALVATALGLAVIAVAGLWVITKVDPYFPYGPPRPGTRYVVPPGFVGCITLEHGIVNEPPLVEWDGYQLVEVSRPGEIIRTSSETSGVEIPIDEVWTRVDGGLVQTSLEPTTHFYWEDGSDEEPDAGDEADDGGHPAKGPSPIRVCFSKWAVSG